VLARLTSFNENRFRLQSKLREHAKRTVSVTDMDSQMEGPPFDRAEPAVFEACAKLWIESSLSLQALCSSRGIVYLHVLQPTLHDPGSKPLSAEELALAPGPPEWRPGVLTGYPMLRSRSKTLAQRGVWFLDESQAFAHTPETLYFDACHFHPPGNRILARDIAPFFLEHVLDRHATPRAHVSEPGIQGESR
jgi:hypothetical protein